MENPIKMDDLGVPLFSETSWRWSQKDDSFPSQKDAMGHVMPKLVAAASHSVASL